MFTVREQTTNNQTKRTEFVKVHYIIYELGVRNKKQPIKETAAQKLSKKTKMVAAKLKQRPIIQQPEVAIKEDTEPIKIAQETESAAAPQQAVTKPAKKQKKKAAKLAQQASQKEYEELPPVENFEAFAAEKIAADNFKKAAMKTQSNKQLKEQEKCAIEPAKQPVQETASAAIPQQAVTKSTKKQKKKAAKVARQASQKKYEELPKRPIFQLEPLEKAPDSFKPAQKVAETAAAPIEQQSWADINDYTNEYDEYQVDNLEDEYDYEDPYEYPAEAVHSRFEKQSQRKKPSATTQRDE